MAYFGVNVDPLNPAGAPGPQSLQEAGFTWVRLVCRPAVQEYVDRCRDARINVLAVITEESLRDGVPQTLDPSPTVYQFGNEPDGEGVSSWKMSPDEYVSWWNTHAGQLGAPAIAAGLCSADPADWIDPVLGALDPVPRALAVHPYGATADDATALFAEFARFGLPIWLSEWNPLPRDWTDPSMAADLASVWQVFDAEAEAAFWFCWSDGMVAGLGLVDEGGRPKVAYNDLTALVQPARQSIAQDAMSPTGYHPNPSG